MQYWNSIYCHFWRQSSITCPAPAAACTQTMIFSESKRRKLSGCTQCSGSVAIARKCFGHKIFLILTLITGIVACLIRCAVSYSLKVLLSHMHSHLKSQGCSGCRLKKKLCVLIFEFHCAVNNNQICGMKEYGAF